jgi:hypothetical protein
MRASNTYSLLSRSARTVTRPVTVKPTIRVPPFAQARCCLQLKMLGLNSGTKTMPGSLENLPAHCIRHNRDRSI